MPSLGFFITFEGGEGSGKTTQIQRLAESLAQIFPAGSLVITREPGGVPAAESIRDLLVNGDTEKWQPLTEAFLMSAARHEHVEQFIRPALMQNKLVISDRFTDSTIIYQGVVGGVASQYIDAMNKISCGDIAPDLTIILDMDSQTGLARAGSRGVGENRFEAKGPAFHEKVRAGFVDLAHADTGRCVIIDASRSEDAIADDVLQLVLARLTTVGMIAHD
jgi:dTMP kinase